MMQEIREKLKEKIENEVYECFDEWADNLDVRDFISYADLEERLNNRISQALDVESMIDELIDEVFEDLDI